MQILMGLGHLGELQHTEVLAALSPLQMLSLARARLAEFTRVEVWEETVCVLRLPPGPGRLVPRHGKGTSSERSAGAKRAPVTGPEA